MLNGLSGGGEGREHMNSFGDSDQENLFHPFVSKLPKARRIKRRQTTVSDYEVVLWEISPNLRGRECRRRCSNRNHSSAIQMAEAEDDRMNAFHVYFLFEHCRRLFCRHCSNGWRQRFIQPKENRMKDTLKEFKTCLNVIRALL